MFTRTKITADSNPSMARVAEELTYEKSLAEKSIPAQDQKYLEPDIPVKKTPFYMRTHAKAPPVQTHSTPVDKPVRMAMRSKSTKPANAPTRPSLKATAKPPRRSDAAWDPPPLFQAYPQAIKHAQLSASTLSADSILRISNQNASLAQEAGPISAGNEEQQVAAARKNEKAKSKHRRHVSGSISKADWTQKIYVLVTSGYLLQYSGEGSFDRLPEKMMQLGKDSVAFASDVIPGKHWVLQISQAMDSDGTPAPDARSLMSRLTFRGADYRRAATSLLLILNSAEDLESWITTVRREIEALGGKKHVSETGKPKSDDRTVLLKALPSPRFMVARDPERFSNPPTPLSASFSPPWDRAAEESRTQTMSTDTTSRPMSFPARDSMSIKTSETSHDAQQLESLRDSTYRNSYLSSGQRTIVTSRASSPESSPTRDNFEPMEGPSSTSYFPEEVRPRPNAAAINERRRSMQTFQHHGSETLTTSKSSRPRPHSTFVGPRASQIGSPITTNFSIPHTLNKRHSMSRSPENVPLSPAANIHTPGRKQDTVLKGNRKSPPAPLTSRPLSPVEDQPSPVQQQPPYTPTETSLKPPRYSRPVMPDPSFLPQNDSARRVSSLPDNALFQRGSSISALNALEAENMNSKAPRRYSSVKGLHSPGYAEDFPMKLTLQSPVKPHVIPLPASPIPTMSPELRMPFSKYSEGSPHTISSSSKVRRPASIQVLSPARSHASLKTTGSFDQTPQRELLRSVYSTATPKSVTKSPTSQGAPRSRFSTYDPMTSPTARTSVAYFTNKSPRLASPASTSGLVTPSFQRLRDIDERSLGNRRSMPHLVNGPPPAPPPSCALPPLPPGTPHSAGLRSPLSLKMSINSRSSVRV